jgi:NTE family protein
VGYRLRETDGGTELGLQVRERSWGPGYLQLATRMSGSFDGDDVFGLGVSFLQTEVNRWNAEWRAAAAVGDEPGLSFDFYQPLGVASPWFIEPSLAYTRYTLNLFDAQGGRVSETRITEGGLTLAAGFDVGDWGELRGGWRRVIGESEIQLGDLTQPDGDYDDGELFLQASVDAVDNLYFPGEGVDGRLALRSSRSTYGADEGFDQVSVQGRIVRSWGRFSLRLGGDYHSTYSGIAPPQSLFRAGGLFRLSGYELNELSGQHFAQITMIPSLRVADFAFLPVYLGASLELGNVWQNERDIGFDDTLTAGSLWIGADTWLGPAHVAYGVAEGGRNSFYIFLGPVR